MGYLQGHSIAIYSSTPRMPASSLSGSAMSPLQGFLHSLSQADCEIVCRWLEHEFVAPGAPVYNEGSFGEAM